MRRFKIKQVDAFTDRAFTGNPAAVLPYADGLTDDQMQAIAREMNLSETAYIFKAQDGVHDMEIRWMTPVVEVSACGHGTIAAFHALDEEGLFGLDKKEPVRHFKVKTKGGTLPVEINRETGRTMISFGMPIPKFEEYLGMRFELCNALGISAELIDKRLPVWISELGYVFIPFVDRESLLSMKPNFEDLRHLSHRTKIVGYCAFTTETAHSASAAHARFFAPQLGINEDPVTGTALGPLACYLYLNKELQGEGNICASLEQGYEMHRGGRVWVEMAVGNHTLNDVKISGYAITVLTGEIFV
ncbi:phenazine biosynthesis protein PhzF family [Chloroherpeton thalassium ATCC 35110]|uniref:Phenazine biosynthesis protein PhzF family n=1 Tax=Chloroherpeton thalassium (strain ATCC 35110 / GB-78) TaxID=517418 RepID=B3QW73_CHLT3|nr:PhzF family phenazine biosynthesis protein [Chloroherpeton thalassium]ACF13186.1 phenazine biosynthesis protein PhzF family [Chloroherpeton thalassium ATCC 35110]